MQEGLWLADWPPGTQLTNERRDWLVWPPHHWSLVVTIGQYVADPGPDTQWSLCYECVAIMLGGDMWAGTDHQWPGPLHWPMSTTTCIPNIATLIWQFSVFHFILWQLFHNLTKLRVTAKKFNLSKSYQSFAASHVLNFQTF